MASWLEAEPAAADGLPPGVGGVARVDDERCEVEDEQAEVRARDDQVVEPPLDRQSKLVELGRVLDTVEICMPDLVARIRVIDLDQRVGRAGRFLDSTQLRDHGASERGLARPQIAGQKHGIAGC